jgi:hypothetical protein
MIINLIYDSSANNAPASFKAAMQQAAAILDAAITNPITVTIKVGYGVWPGPGGGTITGGSAEGANDGVSLPYSQVVGDLVANAAPSDTNFQWLQKAQPPRETQTQLSELPNGSSSMKGTWPNENSAGAPIATAQPRLSAPLRD